LGSQNCASSASASSHRRPRCEARSGGTKFRVGLQSCRLQPAGDGVCGCGERRRGRRLVAYLQSKRVPRVSIYGNHFHHHAKGPPNCMPAIEDSARPLYRVTIQARFRFALALGDRLYSVESRCGCDTCRRQPRVMRHAVDGKALSCLVTFSNRSLEVEAVTCCTTNSCLPGHARRETVGCEAPGTKYLSDGRSTLVTRNRYCEQRRGIGTRQVPHAQLK
jgi:hypothetical protein